MRVGMGYDVHKLVEGRRLVLGGVEIPYEKGLLGHSDADVLVHAVMDALLGAAALGDIGKHFPDTDPAYEGADSMKLLEEVRKLLDEHNFMIGNVDATVIAQRPKLAPYIEMMRENIAARLLIDKNQVNVKATTEEGLGFTGQGQGISSQAICLLETIDNFDYRSSRVVDDTVENAVVLASDKGLAGAYASNVFKETVSHIKDAKNTSIITVGRRGKEYFVPRKYDVLNSYMGFTERPEYQNARQIAVEIMEHFSKGDYKEVYLVYTKFVSAISAIPQTIKLLPFTAPESSDHKPTAEYIYEPSAQSVLGYLLPQYIITTIYASLLQSAASELSSRMNAMSNATDNAEELISKLDLHYNKVRQAGITREITEIVGGAEALK